MQVINTHSLFANQLNSKPVSLTWYKDWVKHRLEQQRQWWMRFTESPFAETLLKQVSPRWKTYFRLTGCARSHTLLTCPTELCVTNIFYFKVGHFISCDTLIKFFKKHLLPLFFHFVSSNDIWLLSPTSRQKSFESE